MGPNDYMVIGLARVLMTVDPRPVATRWTKETKCVQRHHRGQ